VKNTRDVGMASACVCDVDESASRTWTKCVTDRVVAAGGLFEIASGACTVYNSARCFRSPSYPSDYAINQQCTITAREQMTLSVTAFNTESGYDNLIVNGVQYSGTTGPGGVNSWRWRRARPSPSRATVQYMLNYLEIL
jgi:hypothetical protein